MTIRIGLIQMVCEKAAMAENLASIAHYLAEAAVRKIDIVGFPEMSITGYADPTRYPEAQLTLDSSDVARFLTVTQGFSGIVLAGIIEANPNGKPFITHLIARDGVLLGHYRKITIEDEEIEWFSAGDSVPIFQSGSLPFSLAICADLTNPAVFASSRQQGARLIFELAAPGLYGEQSTRNWATSYAWWEAECQEYLSRYAKDYGVWILVATQAGRTRDEDFPGGGFVFAPNGERVFATPDWQPGAVFLEIDLENGTVSEIP
jgi:predicted amidohydrolase